MSEKCSPEKVILELSRIDRGRLQEYNKENKQKVLTIFASIIQKQSTFCKLCFSIILFKSLTNISDAYIYTECLKTGLTF